MKGGNAQHPSEGQSGGGAKIEPPPPPIHAGILPLKQLDANAR